MIPQNNLYGNLHSTFLNQRQGEDKINQYDREDIVAGNSILDTALSYCNAGLSVVPMRPDGSKAPAVRWQLYQDTPPTREEVEAWFKGRYQDCGVGIVTGRASGNLEVIDFDDAQAFTTWQGLIGEQNPALLERLVLIKTPRGGTHVLYRCDTIEGNQKLAQRRSI